MDKHIENQSKNFDLTFKSIKSFDDLVEGVEHWNGSGEHANKFKKLSDDEVTVTHVHRFDVDKNPFVLTKTQFNNWLKEKEIA